MVVTSAGDTGTRSSIGAFTVLLALALTVGACAVSGVDSPVETAQEPRDELAAPARVKQRPASTTATTTPAATATSGRSVPRVARSQTGPGLSPSPVAEETPVWRSVLRLADPSGDSTLTGGRGYADLVGVRMDDDGGRARVTVSLAEDVPSRLGDGEVVGIGVDLFRSSGREGDYQVFLDGGASGWRAFLQAPRGFVRFPGTFAIDGSRMVIELPWADLGGRSGGRVAAFADWSAGDALGSSTQDRAPDTGTRRFAIG